MTGFVRALGFTLLHFLWQGALIASIAAIALKGMVGRDARHRYQVCLLALLGCVIAPCITMGVLIFNPVILPSSALDTLLLQPIELPVAAKASAKAISSVDLISAMVGAWILGAACVAACYAIQWRGVVRVRKSAVPFAASQLFGAIAVRMLARWKVTAGVRVMLSELVVTPMVIGVWRPMIIFPAATIARMPVADFELLLLHEIAHILRRDTWVNALQIALEIVFFYHPVIHWLSRRTRLERECACDDFVVSATGAAYPYAQALATLALTGVQIRSPVLAAAGGDLLPRLRYLAGECIDSEALPRIPLHYALLALLLCGIWMQIPSGEWRESAETALWIPSLRSVTEEHRTTQPTIAEALPTMPPSLLSSSLREASEIAPSPYELTGRTNAPTPGPLEILDIDAAARITHSSAAMATLDTEPASAAMSTELRTLQDPVSPTDLVPDESEPELAVVSEPALVPTFSPLPEYPLRARLDGIEGSVAAVVRVAPDGRPTGLHIVEAEPLGVFEGAVRRALMRWRYDVSSMTESSERTATHRLRFSIAGVSSIETPACTTATATRTCVPR